MDAADYRPSRSGGKVHQGTLTQTWRKSVGAPTVARLGRADWYLSAIVHWFLFNDVFRMRAAFRVVPESRATRKLSSHRSLQRSNGCTFGLSAGGRQR